jgi:hypothetical protein
MSLEPFDPSDPLEARLRAMRPAELPLELADTLVRIRPHRNRWVVFAAPLAAAAVLLIAFLGWLRPGPANLIADAASKHPPLQPSDLRVLVPIEERSTLVEVLDLGVLDTVPTRPVRLMSYRWIDDTTFRGDDGHSTFRRTQPREQIVPVVLQVY